MWLKEQGLLQHCLTGLADRVRVGCAPQLFVPRLLLARFATIVPLVGLSALLVSPRGPFASGLGAQIDRAIGVSLHSAAALAAAWATLVAVQNLRARWQQIGALVAATPFISFFAFGAWALYYVRARPGSSADTIIVWGECLAAGWINATSNAQLLALISLATVPFLSAAACALTPSIHFALLHLGLVLVVCPVCAAFGQSAPAIDPAWLLSLPIGAIIVVPEMTCAFPVFAVGFTSVAGDSARMAFVLSAPLVVLKCATALTRWRRSATNTA